MDSYQRETCNSCGAELNAGHAGPCPSCGNETIYRKRAEVLTISNEFRSSLTRQEQEKVDMFVAWFKGKVEKLELERIDTHLPKPEKRSEKTSLPSLALTSEALLKRRRQRVKGEMERLEAEGGEQMRQARTPEEVHEAKMKLARAKELRSNLKKGA